MIGRRYRAWRTRRRGQATTEFVLLVALISVPIYILLRVMMQVVVSGFIATLIERFTRG